MYEGGYSYYLHPLMRVGVAVPALSEFDLTIYRSNLQNETKSHSQQATPLILDLATRQRSAKSQYFPYSSRDVGSGVPETHHDKRTRDVDSIEQHLPVGPQFSALDALDRDVLLAGNRPQPPLHVGLEALGDNVEANGDDAEKTKG